MRNQVIGRRAEDGGLLPLTMSCCGGVQYAYVDLGDSAEAARWIHVEQHELFCCCAR
jgi:hypothetical protein